MAKKKDIKCYPLSFIKQARDAEGNDALADSTILDVLVDGKSYTKDEVMDYLVSVDFPTEDNGDIVKRDTNEFIQKAGIPYIQQMLNMDISWDKIVKSTKYKRRYRTELLDLFIPNYVFHIWEHNKQVYKPDKDFIDALLGSEKISVTPEMFKHLPSEVYYIDLSDMPEYDPIVGVFSYIRVSNNTLYFCQEFLAKDLIFFSHNSMVRFDDECEEIELPLDEALVGKETDKLTMSEDICMPKLTGDYTEVRPRQVAELSIMMALYLVSREPDIAESMASKQYYRPNTTGTIKNKFSEIQEWDVGIRYGTQLRDFYKKAEAEEYNGGESQPSGTRKPVKPHFRRGHWHKYWCGQGRKRLEVKWVAHTFVAGGQAQDVVIH